jgi:hypothetical protein
MPPRGSKGTELRTAIMFALALAAAMFFFVKATERFVAGPG